MPFVSQAQRRYFYSKKPELAKEFEAATPKGAKLPQHVKQDAIHRRLKRHGRRHQAPPHGK